MKFHLPSISSISSFFKEPATQDTENVRNRHAPETSPPPDLQPENTKRRHHRSSSWLKNMLPKRKKSGMPAHASHEAPGPSNRQSNLPQAAPIHRPTFELSHPIWNEIEAAEKQVAESITQDFSPDALKTAKFKNMVQDCINHGLDALDQKFDHIQQNLLPGQSLEIVERTREHAKECVRQSGDDACYALYAKAMDGVEKDMVKTIRHALAGSGRDTLPELEKKMQFCINYGLSALDQKFDQIVQNLLPGQSPSSIERIRERAKERILQSTSDVRNVIHTNVNETAQIEKEVAGIIAHSLSEIGKDTLPLAELKSRAQDCIDHGLNALDQKFDHMLQNLLPWQTRDKLERTREQAKERVLQSAHEACHALYAKEMDRIEANVVKDITYALVGSAPSELKNVAADCITYGLDVLDQKFDHMLQNLLPGQSRDKIERTREQAKERIIQSTRDVGNAINANVNAMAQIEEDVVKTITDALAGSASSELKNMAADCIVRGFHALDQTFDHILQNLLPGQPRDKIEITREQAKDRIMRSTTEALHHALYANEMVRLEEEVVGNIARAVAEIGKDTYTLSEFKKMEEMVQDCRNDGLHAFDLVFDHARQHLLPGQSDDKLKETRQQAIERLNKSIDKTCREAGWEMSPREGGNIEWVSPTPTGPLLIKRGLSLHQLKLNKENLAQGAFGSVSIFENENGDKLIGKTIHDKRDVVEELAKELEAYQTIYDKAGPHRNLVNAYGVALVPHGEKIKHTMLMDMIPGKNGSETFDALRKCWDAGKISSEQYWGAMQFIGRRLLDVTEHLAKAEVVHNDIKPENFMVNKETGEPVLIDLGLWTKPGKKHRGGTPFYQSPETRPGIKPKDRPGVDERSDVFTVGASLLDGVEGLLHGGYDGSEIWANEGLLQQPAFRDTTGNMVREPATYSAETAYTRFMNSILEKNQDIRFDSDMAKTSDFLSDSMLDGDAAKAVIKKVMELVSEEEQKPKKEQWKQAKPGIQESEVLPKNRRQQHMDNLLHPFLYDETFIPSLADYANLHNESRINPRLRNFLNTDALDYLQDDLEQQAAHVAGQLIADASWFNAVKKITETVNVKSEVNENGVRLNPENQYIDPAYKNSVIRAKKAIKSPANIDVLRHYAKDAEEFLRDAMALKRKENPEIADQLEQVKERAAVARRMVEIFDTESEKPGNVEERVLEFERQRIERQLKRRK